MENSTEFCQKKLKQNYLPGDLAIHFWVYIQINHYFEELSACSLFTILSLLLTIANTWKQPKCHSWLNEGINKLSVSYTHTGILFSHLKRESCYLQQYRWILQKRQWYPTPVLLPGESQGWGSLVGCSPWGR